jgi:foldase protein PrsA
VRELTKLGLKEAKDLVDGAPSKVLEKVSKEDGQKALQKLVEDQKASILSSGYYTDWVTFQEQTGISDEYFAQLIKDNELQKNLIEAHGPARNVEQVHAQHILVADEATAQTVIERLNAGEDFAVVAKELSTDTGSASNGGDLGWFPKGAMVKEFEDAAFSLEPGTVSKPVKTDYGYHIIKVLEKGMRDLDDQTYSQLAQPAFLSWFQEQVKKAAIEVKVKFKE